MFVAVASLVVKAVVAVLEDEDESQREDLADEKEEEDHKRVLEQVEPVKFLNKVVVNSLNKVENQPIRVRDGEDSKYK